MTTDPLSLQARVGGPFSFFSQQRTHSRYKRESVGHFLPFLNNRPTLATNTSRWAVFFLFSTMDPPSLQTRVGGPFSFFSQQRTHPCYKRESVGRFISLLTTTDPPSLQVRVSEPFSFFSQQCKPMRAHANQRRPMKANASQREPTQANRGQQRPSQANEDPRKPTKNHANQQRPTRAQAS